MAATSHLGSFGKYVLLRKLASGGMGEVFLAKQRGPSGFEKHIVIKRILSHHLDKPDYIEMFFGEAKLVARLNHHNIIQIYEMGQIRGDHYIAMEYVRGKSLRDIIDELRSEARHLPLAHVVDLAIKLCEGLGYAHAARDPRGAPMNIIHRDVNPHNVLVSYNGDLKIIDFGIAKSEMSSVHTATGTIKGKFVYMSPEQSAADPLDRRSDIFSLGIVIYELACLENPFVRQNVVLSLEAIQRQDVPPPSSRRPEAHPLDAIVARALAKRPDDRYQTALELRDALRGLFRGGAVRPEAQDLSSLLQDVFASDIQQHDRALTEAEVTLANETANQPLVSDAEAHRDPIDALSSEPPSLANTSGSDAGIELTSGQVLLGVPALQVTTPRPHRGLELPSTPPPRVALSPPAEITSGLSFPPLSSLELEKPLFAPGEASVAALPSPSQIPTTPMTRRPPIPPPRPLASDSEGSAPALPPVPVTRPSGPARDESAAPAPLAEPLSVPAVVAAPAPVDRWTPRDPIQQDTEESVSRLPTPLRRVGWMSAYLALLGVTALFGFLITRALLSGPHNDGSRSDMGYAAPPLPALDLPDDDRWPPLESADEEEEDPTDLVGDDAESPVEIAARHRIERSPSSDVAARPSRSASPPRPTVLGSRVAGPQPSPRPAATARRIRRSAPAKGSNGRFAPEAREANGHDNGHSSRGAAGPRKTERRPASAAIRAPLSQFVPVEQPPPRAKLWGRLVVQANRPVRVEHAERLRSTPAALPVRQRAGRVVISAQGFDYRVVVAYRVLPSGLSIRVDAEPWAIVQHDGLSLGRTPQGPLAAASIHRLTLLKPGQPGSFAVSLLWRPSQ